MSTADQLLPLIFSWIEKRERCADQLIKLARELESLREKCNAGECVGSSVAVLGAACVIGAGLATMFTGGAAAPLLGGLGAAYTGTGIAISVGAKITEAWISSDTMKEVKEVEKRSNETADKIQQLFDKLRAEAKAENPSAGPDELDRHITSKILTSMARRSGVNGQVRIRLFNGRPQISLTGGLVWSGVNCVVPCFEIAASAMVGIFAFFKSRLTRKKYELLFAEGGKQLVQQMSTTTAKTVLKGGAKAVGGAVLLVFALNEAIDNWTEMIKKNHMTEASQSVRDTADSIRKATQMLRKQLDSIKKMLDEMAKYQQEQEEKEKKKKRKAKVLFVVTVQSNCSADDSHGNTDARAKYQRRQTEKNYQEGGRCEKPGGQEAGGDTGGERQGGDAGGQRSDSDEEDSDSDEEDSDSDEEDSDSDEEDSDSDNSSDPKYQLSIYEYEDGSSDFSSDSICQPSNRKDEIPMGLINIRSINKKQSRISNVIKKFNLKVFTLNETWNKLENGGQRLGKILPKQFHFVDQPRGDEEGKSKRGGGVAILYSKKLRGRSVQCEDTFFKFLKSFKSFEYVAADLHHDEWTQPIWTITVYRPPGEQDVDKFLEEFQSLLNKFSKDNSVLITGDFNIWVNDKNCNFVTTYRKKYELATRFKELLKDNGLLQHVKERTHDKGNTLDLVITRNVDISDLRVKKPKTKTKTKTKKKTKKNTTISDHYAVLFSASPSENTLKRKHTESPDPPSKQFKDEKK